MWSELDKAKMEEAGIGFDPVHCGGSGEGGIGGLRYLGLDALQQGCLLVNGCE